MLIKERGITRDWDGGLLNSWDELHGAGSICDETLMTRRSQPEDMGWGRAF